MTQHKVEKADRHRGLLLSLSFHFRRERVIMEKQLCAPLHLLPTPTRPISTSLPTLIITNGGARRSSENMPYAAPSNRLIRCSLLTLCRNGNVKYQRLPDALCTLSHVQTNKDAHMCIYKHNDKFKKTQSAVQHRMHVDGGSCFWCNMPHAPYSQHEVSVHKRVSFVVPAGPTLKT